MPSTIVSYWAEVAVKDFVVGEQVRVNADLFEGLRHFVAGAHDVADLEVRRNFYIDSARAIRRGMVVVIWPHAGIADLLHTFTEFEVAAAGYGLDRVAVGAQ